MCSWPPLLSSSLSRPSPLSCPYIKPFHVDKNEKKERDLREIRSARTGWTCSRQKTLLTRWPLQDPRIFRPPSMVGHLVIPTWRQHRLMAPQGLQAIENRCLENKMEDDREMPPVRMRAHALIKAVFLILMNRGKKLYCSYFSFFCFLWDRVLSSSPGCNSLCRSSRPRVSRECLVSVWLWQLSVIRLMAYSLGRK